MHTLATGNGFICGGDMRLRIAAFVLTSFYRFDDSHRGFFVTNAHSRYPS